MNVNSHPPAASTFRHPPRDALGAPHSKALYHIRFLLDVGLIVLVDQQIKGGNVEKYYRAVARMFGLHPGPDDPFDFTGWLEAVQQEVAASAARWPAEPQRYEIWRARLAPARLEEFDRRPQALINEYWGGPETLPVEDPSSPQLVSAEVIYRDPAAAPRAGVARTLSRHLPVSSDLLARSAQR